MSVIERYGSTVTSRQPFLPNSLSLQKIIKENCYPSPYKNEKPIFYAKTFSQNNDETCVISGKLYHAVDKISFVSALSFLLTEEAILAANNIELKAKRIILEDNPENEIQTTVIAHKTLSIRCTNLIIDGANLPRPNEVKISCQTLSLENLPENSLWLKDFLPRNQTSE